MKKIIGIITVLCFWCAFVNANIGDKELPSKKFFKENIEVKKEESPSSSSNNSSILKNETSIKAFGLDDDDTGEAGGGFVGSDPHPVPAGDALFPMLLAGGLYMFFLNRKRRK